MKTMIVFLLAGIYLFPLKEVAPIAVDPSILGTFDGRSPCQDIARDLNAPVREECIKIKWRLILFQDPTTHQPTTYQLQGFIFRNPAREGKWAIIRGTATNPGAVVYQLDPDKPKESFFFLKGDDNVLFFLDKDKNVRVGNKDFSYTLNRKID